MIHGLDERSVPTKSSGLKSLARRLRLQAFGLFALMLGAGALLGGAKPASAQIPGALNVSLTANPTSAAVGQQVQFTYSASPPPVAPPFPSIQQIQISFGDGQGTFGNMGFSGQTVTGTVTHAYSSPGQYTATLTATASNFQSGTDTATVFVGGGGVQPPGPPFSSTVNYQPGWNLVGGPSGTVLQGAVGTLWSWPAGANNYSQMPIGVGMQAGAGYWAYFPAGATVTLATAPSASVSVPVQAGQWQMIGNPGNATATISDPSVTMLVYQPSIGTYAQVSTLDPGQGAWVYSFRSAFLTITSGPGFPPPIP